MFDANLPQLVVAPLGPAGSPRISRAQAEASLRRIGIMCVAPERGRLNELHAVVAIRLAAQLLRDVGSDAALLPFVRHQLALFAETVPEIDELLLFGGSQTTFVP